jgi:hypothetical protein
MTISFAEYQLIALARDEGVLPDRPTVLEFGEANWYGDVPLNQLASDVLKLVPDEAAQQSYIETLKELGPKSQQQPMALFEIAKVFYQVFLQYQSIEAVDLSGTPAAYPWNLNEPINAQLNQRQFDITLDFGTAEHVFNVYQFFKTVHEATKPSGLMLHGVPFQGWYDHGFYNFQPTFFFDLAEANDYFIHGMFCMEIEPFRWIPVQSRQDVVAMVQEGQLGKNPMLYTILRKPAVEKPFCAPMQGIYANKLSEPMKQAWKTLR